jgi:hypothetical protein
VGPAELLLSMGFLVYFSETNAAMLGASRMSTKFIPYATALGYSPSWVAPWWAVERPGLLSSIKSCRLN